MIDNFDTIRYRKRVLVETKFSVLKRRFGGDLKSRLFQIQKKEISCKIILANLDRIILVIWFEGFYRAQNENRIAIDPDQFSIGIVIAIAIKKSRIDLHTKIGN